MYYFCKYLQLTCGLKLFHLLQMNSILLVIYGQFTGNLFYLLDKKKVIRKVVTSRVCEYLPKILEVGRLRTRYPIVQQHGAGDPAWMETSALTEVILRPATFMSMFPQDAKRTLYTAQPSVTQARCDIY